MSTTMNMSPKNLMILAALGIGAYFLTTRRAVAGTTTGQVPLPWSQSPTRAITANGQPAAGNQGLVTAGLNLFNNLISAGSAPLVRTPGFNPGYYPDTAGEVEARNYYLANPDAFAVNPPTSYQSNDGFTGGTGGWLDSQ